MEKKLSEMSLEELWQMFPIFLTGHKDCWEEWYNQEEAALEKILPKEKLVRISHIGSTSIQGSGQSPLLIFLWR